MNRSQAPLITQQMYTRERRGIYRATEGFDTVAKSEGLDNNFIKKILHPFCLYDAPAELSSRGEKDESQYPAALHLFHTETGETVIGSSSYQATDFTGQRSAFFAHNFIVPASRGDEILHRYSDWLHADFARELKDEPGAVLPELSEIPVDRSTRGREPAAVLNSLGIDEVLFKNLLQAVMTAVAGKKKIYITLDVPISELSIRAAELTEVLFRTLPYEFRRRLGVITYANEPKSRKYIHITFVEKGSLRPGDRSIEKDFIIDLASGRTANVDFGAQRQPYADFAWNALHTNVSSLEDFASFSGEMLKGRDGERSTSLAVYNELAVFYEIEQGNEALYEDNKISVLSGLLSYLKAEGALDSKVRLNDLFLERFDREFDLIRQKGILVPAIMDSFKAYFSLKGHTYKGKIVDYFINGMLNSQAAGQDDVVKAAYSIIESDDELGRAFFTRLLSQPVFRGALFEPYVEARLGAAGRAADIMSFVVNWGRFLPEALQLPFVKDAVRDYLLEKLKLEKEAVTAVAAVHDTVQRVEKERRKGSGVSPETLILLQTMASAADRYLLQNLSLEDITQEQLLELPFVHFPSGVTEWSPPLDYVSKRKANVLRAAYRWFGEEKPDVELFAELTPQELDDVQLLGRRWLKASNQVEPFDRLPLAFYYSNSREGGPLDYAALFELIRSKPGFQEETMYRFLAWSDGNPLFMISSKKLQPEYRRAIMKYFLTHDREAFKNRDFRKNVVAAAGPALQNVYSEIRSKLSSPLARWIQRSRFQLMISGMLLVSILLITLILINVLGSGGKDTALPQTSPGPTAGVGSEPTTDMAAVYLDTRTSEGEGSSLLFKFAVATDCELFNPEEVSVESSGGVSESYRVSAVTKSCTVTETPSSAAPESDETAVNTDSAAVTDSAEGTDSVTATSSVAVTDSAQGGGSNTASTETATALPATPNLPFQAEVVLETKAALLKGSLIKAEGYTLTLMAEPSAAPTSSPAPSASPATDDTNSADDDSATPEPTD
ncbi:hypothetical protein [Paenibacillus sp. sgz500958]|uniref:GAP1-N2 domain-containing protein n=1 Tax=Paenibacillus sp. sgz500958 TaxID=3242475 RepID=UPI0036D3F94B